MRKITIIALVSATLLSSSYGNITNTIQFGLNNSTTYGWFETGVSNGTPNEVASFTENGITFSLHIAGSTNINGTMNFTGLFGGIDDRRIDQGAAITNLADANPLDDQWVKLTVSVSGATNDLTSLSIPKFDFRYIGAGDIMEATDGITTITNATRAVTYGTQFSGLTPLSLANVDSWELTLTARDALTTTLFSLYQLDLQYSIAVTDPIVNDDTYVLPAGDTNIAVDAASGVLDNDLNTVSAVLVTNVSNGILNLSADGSFTYTATNGFIGVDTFNYVGVNGSSVTSSTPATVSITVVAADIVLYYPFDTDLTDASGNGNDGIYGGSNATISATSKFGGGSLSTAGIGYVNLSNELSFESTDDWSLSMWINSSDTSLTNNYNLAGKSNDRNSSFAYNKSGGPDRNYFLRAGHSSDSATWVSTTAPTALDSGVWHHLVLTCTGAGNDLKFYEDGVEYSSWPSGDETLMRFNAIGTGHHDHGGIFNGFIDEVRIANYAFSSNDVVSLYLNNELDGPVINNPATIIGFEGAAFDTMMMTIALNAEADASAYYPMGADDLVTSNWVGVAHSDAADGTFSETNLTFAAGDATNKVIYVKSTNPVEFFRIDIN